MSQLSNLYEKLLSGEKITVEMDVVNFNSFYSQLRSIKSRYDKKFKEITGTTVSAGKVIRYEQNNEAVPPRFLLYLGERKISTKLEYKIITNNTDDNEE